MPTAAIYCRVSTENQEQEGSSLQSQRGYSLRKAQDLGYDVPDELIFSEVFSGADTDRPKLNELRQLVRSHSVDAVVCYSTDRLARNPIHIAIIAEECEKRSIELLFVTEPLDKTPEGALIRYVKGYAAQIEREKIRERSLRGKREKARQGKLSTGGPRLYGYDVVEGRRVIDDTEAEVIRRIFTWFAEGGYTLYESVRQLNQERIPGPAGGKWSENTIYRILTHTAYFGVTYAFRYKCVELKRTAATRRTRSTRELRDMSEWIEIPGATPAIVSKEVYDAAQEQLKKNRHRSPTNRKHQYLFTGGRLRCGTCGRSMPGCVKKKNEKPWLYYRCICNVKSNYYEKCPQPSISASKIEAIVWTNLLDILDHPDMLIEQIQSRRMKNQDPAVIEAEEHLIQNTIKKLHDEENRYIELYGKNKISENSFETLVEKVRENIQRQEKRLRDLQSKRESLERVEANTDKLEASARVFSKVLYEADYPLKLKALEALDIQVTYTPEKDIIIDGLLPVGATNLEEKLHVVNSSSLHFSFVCKETTVY